MVLRPYGACVAAAMLLAALVLVLRRKRISPAAGVWDALTLAGLCGFAGLVFARLVYCVFNISWYVAMQDLGACLRIGEGGFLLFGAVAGVALGSLIFSKAAGVSCENTLNSLCVPGLLCVALCRAAEWFPFEGVGPYIENEALHFFPLAVCNEWGEWYLAVFVLEALAALILMIISLRGEKRGDDRLFLHMLTLYAAIQIVLENLRMDSCLMLGFVRVTQVLAAAVLLAMPYLLCRGHARPARLAHLAAIVCMGGVGFTEWAMDKTNIPNLLLYLIMILCCGAAAFAAFRAEKAVHKEQNIHG